MLLGAAELLVRLADGRGRPLSSSSVSVSSSSWILSIVGRVGAEECASATLDDPKTSLMSSTRACAAARLSESSS